MLTQARCNHGPLQSSTSERRQFSAHVRGAESVDSAAHLKFDKLENRWNCAFLFHLLDVRGFIE